jgi:N-acetylglucosaminyldiphosphoundecaprenol N-acetyl-beta-D-mannosaminyltransferase
MTLVIHPSGKVEIQPQQHYLTMSFSRVSLFSIEIDVVKLPEALLTIERWLDEDRRDFRFVVTPNVDHIVRLNQLEDFRAAYRAASLVLADGKPVVLASWILGRPLPETVCGSDLIPALFEHYTQRGGAPLRVFLLGAAPGVADLAKANIEKRWSGVEVTGTYSPPFGFENSPNECKNIIDIISKSNPDLLVVGFGSPKQELWVHRHADELPVKVALCAGATIDFLSGKKSRAPIWMRRISLEWLYRIMLEPRRLTGRYAYDTFVFPRLLATELWKRYAVR